MEAFRLVDAPMLEARRSRAAALAGSEDAEGLAERVTAAARARRNWLLPGNRLDDEDAIVAQLRGRGIKGDLWRFAPARRLGRALSRASDGRHA